MELVEDPVVREMSPPREVENRSLRFGNDPEEADTSINGGNREPHSPLMRRSSFADQSQTNLDIGNGHKVDLQTSYQETLENYYPEGRGSMFSNGPNTFTAKDDLFPKYATLTASTAAKLDEEGDMYEVPDIMGLPRSDHANGVDRMRLSEHSGQGGRRSARNGNIRRRGRTKTSLQQNGAEGLHKDNGCCNDQQCAIF